MPTLELNALAAAAAQRRASDIHIVPNSPVKCRIDGDIANLTDEIADAQSCETLCRDLSNNHSLDGICELDGSALLAGIRVRYNIFRREGGYGAAIRLLSDKIPPLEALGLPEGVSALPQYKTGLVIVTGETGSGKSTTLAAIIDEINKTRRAHIITLEDPIEYIYRPDNCIISQRELHRDTQTYADGLRAALREDPDVILIGEMRDPETIETALTAAETGHLVFATLHTNSAADCADRIIGVFPGEKQPQIRMQLSMTLRAVLAQQLVKKIGGGRACACEMMTVSPAIANLIREGKTPQIESFISIGSQKGCVTMDARLAQLVKDRIISRETAAEAARSVQSLEKQLRI